MPDSTLPIPPQGYWFNKDTLDVYYHGRLAKKLNNDVRKDDVLTRRIQDITITSDIVITEG